MIWNDTFDVEHVKQNFAMFKILSQILRCFVANFAPQISDAAQNAKKRLDLLFVFWKHVALKIELWKLVGFLEIDENLN